MRKTTKAEDLEKDVQKLERTLGSMQSDLARLKRKLKEEKEQYIYNPDVLWFEGACVRIPFEYKATTQTEVWSKGSELFGRSSGKGLGYKVKGLPDHKWSYTIRILKEDYYAYIGRGVACLDNLLTDEV